MIGDLNAAEIEQLLRRETTGRIGCHVDPRTYVVPITYVYEAGNVYGHSSEGMKLRMMRQNPNVCFEVDRVEDAGNWQSVIAWGRFEELRGEEAIRAMDLWIERFAGLVLSETSHPSYVLRRAAVGSPQDGDRGVILYRITLSETTGRFEKGLHESRL